MSNTPLTHGTNDNPSESGTTRCGLAFTPGARLYIVGKVWTRETVLGAASMPSPCPTCFPVAGDNAELRGLAEAREALARIDEQRGPYMLADLLNHLRTALAEVDRLRAENEGLRARIGRTDITRDAYETLIADDGAWLLSHPRTVERDHILAVLTWSIGALYGNDRVPTLPTDRSDK